MAKTLILNLGEAGNAVAPPVARARVEIDGMAPSDIRGIYIELDASKGGPGHFHLERAIVLNGLEWTAEEAHVISNMSLIIEYQESDPRAV